MLSFKVKRSYLSVCTALSLSMSAGVAAESGVTFVDVVPGAKSGISYERTPSATFAAWDAKKKDGVFYPWDSPENLPANAHGAPGIAIFDYDRDGDLDLYVSNGPGTANSLFSNQLVETGAATYVDVATAAGVDLTAIDSSGACYGDIDNDGDIDLIVGSVEGTTSLFENNGNGTFKDISESSTINALVRNSSGCTVGDINGDGLLDIAIANSYSDWSNRVPLMTFSAPDRREQNQLFLNKGNGVFEDVSESAGIANFAGITWGIGLVDYDLDGDVDFITGDDQGPKSPAKYDGKDVGLLRIYQNDGTGQFTDLTAELGTGYFGAWMGLSFGDLNHDGNMDIFGTNVGEYLSLSVEPVVDFPPVIGEWASAIFFGQDNGTFVHDGTNQLAATVFGWGSSIIDYNNDGDTDLIYYGGLDMGLFIDASNPGAMLQNDGAGNFEYDAAALAGSTNHNRRTVKGVAVNDLDRDGFVDIVAVSAEDWPEEYPLLPYAVNNFGSTFDGSAKTMPTMIPNDPNDISKGFLWSGMDAVNGSLSVEMNQADNTNGWARVNLLGTIGITDMGKVNRDGIGAVVSFTPTDGITAMRPIVVGGSYLSAENIESIFGLGEAASGTVDVLWPGGVKNKVFNVYNSEDLLVPEIPCSYADTDMGYSQYIRCVVTSVRDVRATGAVDFVAGWKLGFSALKARTMYRAMNNG